MKKIFGVIFSLLIALSLFALETSSYIDGEVQVGKDGDLPKGFFIKASGYLPGDSVSVTNPLNGNTVELLNLGSVDNSEGFVALVSKEGAEKLGLPENAIIKMKLTSRQGSYDSSVSGVGVLSSILTAEEASAKKALEEKQELDLPAEAAPELSSEKVEEDAASEKEKFAAAEPVDEYPLPSSFSESAVEPALVDEIGEESPHSSSENSLALLEPVDDSDAIASASGPQSENDKKESPLEPVETIPMDSYREKVSISEPASERIEAEVPTKAEKVEEDLGPELIAAVEPEASTEAEKVEEDLGPELIAAVEPEASTEAEKEEEDLGPELIAAVEPESPETEEKLNSDKEISYTYVPLEPVKVISNIKEGEPSLDMDGEVVSHVEPGDDEIVEETPISSPEDRYELVTDISEPVAVIIPAASAPDEDYAGEEVVPVEPVLEEPVAEINLDGEPAKDLPEEEVVSEEPVVILPVEGDMAGEEIIPMEPEEEEEPPVEEVFVPVSPSDDLSAEEVIAMEPVYVPEEEIVVAEPIEELEPASDLPEEEVIALEPSEKEEVVVTEEPVALDPYPAEDSDGERVAAEEPLPEEVKTESEERIEETAVVVEEPSAEKKDIPAEPEEKVYEPIPIAPAEKEEAYKPIVLEPAAEKIPPAPEKKEEKVKEEKKVEKDNVSDKIESHIVEEKNLASSRYYVQIALMKDRESIGRLIDKYDNYPIVLIPRKNGSYSVLVGPLTEDEYGVVLENFKSYGYKDAFIKKIR